MTRGGPSNATVLEFVAQSGEKLALNLSPEAAFRTIVALLSADPKVAQTPIQAMGVQAAIAGHQPILHFQIATNAAIPLGLPADAIPQLRAVLDSLEEMIRKNRSASQ